MRVKGKKTEMVEIEIDPHEIMHRMIRIAILELCPKLFHGYTSIEFEKSKTESSRDRFLIWRNSDPEHPYIEYRSSFPDHLAFDKIVQLINAEKILSSLTLERN